ncbi:MAG: transcriptional regulator NrdR [Oscillospiraceae bacterium]|nr:transcriptional regulator NrdR [Oscillospiraceae bacterium]
MKCLFCGYFDSKVIDSRATEDNAAIRRRRECLQCGKRFTTYEKIETIPVVVLKKDNSRQPFDRNKILNGLMSACKKRQVSLSQMVEFVDEIETKIYNSMEREVTSKKIGEMIMEKLKTFDQVAYVRFASVYKEFNDLNTFVEELDTLIKDKAGE